MPLTAKAVLSAAAKKVGSDLRARGFRRTGLKFVRQGDEVVSMIQLQASRSGTAEAGTFVVNFGVLVPCLYIGQDIAKPVWTDCHWRERVSRVGREAWFPFRANDDVDGLAARLTEIVEHDVLPVLETLQREEDLIALWKTGQGPGLGELNRLLLLGTLLHRAGRRSELSEIEAELELKADDAFARRALAKLRELDG